MKRLALLLLLLAAPLVQAQPKEHPRGHKDPSPEVAARRHKEAKERNDGRVEHLRQKLTTPASLDIDALGWTGPIRDQRNCGTCWLVSGNDIMTNSFIKSGQFKADGSDALSDQYGLDQCPDTNGGCDGDDAPHVFEWGKAKGTPKESAYGPYTAAPGPCRYTNQTLYTIKDWGYCTPAQGQGIATTQDMQNCIVAYGEISTAVAANADWDIYTSGVMPYRKLSPSAVNHDVGITGWDNAKKQIEMRGPPGMQLPVESGPPGAWKVRNQWSKTWGMNGYCWLYYGSHQIGTEAAWVSVVALPPPPPIPPTPPTPPVPPVPPTGAGTITVQIAGIPDQTFQLKIPTGSTITPGSILLTPEQGKALMDILQQQKQGQKPPCNDKKVSDLADKIDQLTERFEKHKTDNSKNLNDLIEVVAENQKAIMGLMKKQADTRAPAIPVQKREAEPIPAGAARILVKLPSALMDAVIYIDGEPTTSSGAVRSYVTPPLPTDDRYVFDVVAVTKNQPRVYRRVAFSKNQLAVADFTK